MIGLQIHPTKDHFDVNHEKIKIWKKRSDNFTVGMSDSFNSDSAYNSPVFKQLIKRALPKMKMVNTSLEGLEYQRLGDRGPSARGHAIYLEIDAPNLVSGCQVNISNMEGYQRVIANTVLWGDTENPDPTTSVPILIRSKGIEFNHLEMPIFQLPRIILDSSTAISEALAYEALSAEASDLILWSVRRSLIASTSQKMMKILRPFQKTLEALKLSPQNPTIDRCANAIAEISQWDRYSKKMKKKLNFGINTISRDYPIILTNDPLLKEEEIRKNVVWWSYDTEAALKSKIVKLEKKIKSLQKKLADLAK